MTSSLLAFAAHLTIAHHIPGRIRLKLNTVPAGGGDMSPQAVIATLSAIDGVKAVSVNPLARSCTIEYDAARISARAWSDLIGNVPSDDGADLLDRLTRALPRAAQ